MPAEDGLDDFVFWALGRAGLDATAYRRPARCRRVPACLRALKVRSALAARRLVERQPRLAATIADSLLIGATEFFREPDVFQSLATQVLPALASLGRPLRIWSAACSTGAELYSVAILLAEARLLERSFLLGTDCRSDAIDRAKQALYDPIALRLVESAEAHFEVVGWRHRPVAALRDCVHWKVADLLARVEDGPWDIILWRNAAIYLTPEAAEGVWRRLAAVLAPGGVLVAGKAERPPAQAGLRNVARCIYRRSA